MDAILISLDCAFSQTPPGSQGTPPGTLHTFGTVELRCTTAPGRYEPDVKRSFCHNSRVSNKGPKYTSSQSLLERRQQVLLECNPTASRPPSSTSR